MTSFVCKAKPAVKPAPRVVVACPALRTSIKSRARSMIRWHDDVPKKKKNVSWSLDSEGSDTVIIRTFEIDDRCNFQYKSSATHSRDSFPKGDDYHPSRRENDRLYHQSIAHRDAWELAVSLGWEKPDLSWPAFSTKTHRYEFEPYKDGRLHMDTKELPNITPLAPHEIAAMIDAENSAEVSCAAPRCCR